MSYIVKNCPCLMSAIYSDGRETVNECGILNNDEKCYENNTCKFRDLIDAALLEYMTPEQTELSEKEDDRETHLLKCAKHNMAVMILSQLGYEEL